MFEFEKVRTERSAGRQQAGRRRAKGGEPDSAAGVYPGERSPLILLEKLGTDCDDRERKYSLPRIFSVRVGTNPFRHPPTNPPVVLRACGIDGVRIWSYHHLANADSYLILIVILVAQQSGLAIASLK